MSIVMLWEDDQAVIPIDWEDILPTGVTVSTVTHSVPSPLTKSSESNTSTTSAVKVTGAVHGGRYSVTGAATLSNGEVLNRSWPVLGWNEA
jgi:hypothetical protein